MNKRKYVTYKEHTERLPSSSPPDDVDSDHGKNRDKNHDNDSGVAGARAGAAAPVCATGCDAALEAFLLQVLAVHDVTKIVLAYAEVRGICDKCDLIGCGACSLIICEEPHRFGKARDQPHSSWSLRSPNTNTTHLFLVRHTSHLPAESERRKKDSESAKHQQQQTEHPLKWDDDDDVDQDKTDKDKADKKKEEDKKEEEDDLDGERARCSNCNKWQCEDHVTSCPACENPYCYACMSQTCAECEEPTCEECGTFCVPCNVWYCSENDCCVSGHNETNHPNGEEEEDGNGGGRGGGAGKEDDGDDGGDWDGGDWVKLER